MDISKLELTSSEKRAISIIFSRKVFKDVIDKIIAVKKNAIVDEIKTQEELDKARFTLIGNKEIYEIFEGINSEFQVDNTKPEFDPEDMI